MTGWAGAIIAGRLLDVPDVAAPGAPADPVAGLRFQQGVAELLLRQGGASSRSDPVVILASELNAFLGRHFDSQRLALRPLYVRIEDGSLEVAGRTSLRRVNAVMDRGRLVDLLPDAMLDLELWLVVRGHLRIGDGHGELTVDSAAIGRQPVPPTWLWQFLGVSPGDLLAWRMPGIVERVETQPGRLLVHTRRPRG